MEVQGMLICSSNDNDGSICDAKIWTLKVAICGSILM